MKKIFTLLMVIAIAINETNSQVVLNEVYTSPGAGNHEFFELYNTSTDDAPLSVDGFNVVTYFEEGNKKGFYVLDLPALFINQDSYFVGASALPFSYQSTPNSTNANFNWNDPNLAATSGSLQKWVLTGNDNTDGNISYNQEAVPAGFNDLFNKISGGNINYVVYIFKNGLLENSFYGGAGGATTHPSFITSLPQLNLQYIVGGVSNPYSIQFDQLSTKAAEYVISESGTNNGYIRAIDGMCGTWKKSSSSENHTPGVTNGSTSSGSGTVSITATITRGVNLALTSTVSYDITSASSDAFPVELQVYVDNGSIAGDLDALDTYVESNTQTTLAEPGFTTTFSPASANVLIVAKTAAGCFGQVKLVTGGQNQTLPVKLVSFSGHMKGSAAFLTWIVDMNETVERFEVERSYNGGAFQLVKVIAGYDVTGSQTYRFNEPVALNKTINYRLRMIDNNLKAEYSKIIALNLSPDVHGSFAIMQNPVSNNNLKISFESRDNDLIELKVADLTGRLRVSKTMNVIAGSNSVSLSLPDHLTTGLFLVSVRNKSGITTKKFLKQ